MVRINLLPWRYKLQDKQRKRFFFGVFVSLFFGIFIFITYFYFVSSKISMQKRRLDILRNEIKILDEQIKSIESIDKKIKDIIQRKNILKKIRKKKFEKVQLLNSLKRSVPLGVYLIALEEKNNKISIRGSANSETAVSVLLKNFEKNPYFDKIRLRIVEKKEKKKIFELNTSFSYGESSLEPNRLEP